MVRSTSKITSSTRKSSAISRPDPSLDVRSPIGVAAYAAPSMCNSTYASRISVSSSWPELRDAVNVTLPGAGIPRPGKADDVLLRDVRAIVQGSQRIMELHEVIRTGRSRQGRLALPTGKQGDRRASRRGSMNERRGLSLNSSLPCGVSDL